MAGDFTYRWQAVIESVILEKNIPRHSLPSSVVPPPRNAAENVIEVDGARFSMSAVFNARAFDQVAKDIKIRIVDSDQIPLNARVHYFGWYDYTLQSLIKFCDVKYEGDVLLLHSYLDHASFEDPLLRNNRWIGFIHHTFDPNPYAAGSNSSELFERTGFLECLRDGCRGLCVLSQDLCAKIRRALDDRGFSHIPVFVVRHPKLIPEPRKRFTVEKFLLNPDRRLVQIGSWMRNLYAIYELPLMDSKNPLRLRKALLARSSPRIPEIIFDDEKAVRSPTKKCPRRPSCSSADVSFNDLLKLGVSGMLQKQLKSVEVITELSDEGYEVMLGQNIVFLNLVDASAVNTVMECIAFNTPLFVNRLPAIVELLGAGYPGFYDTLIEAIEKLQSIAIISDVHAYLRKLDKNSVGVDTFIGQLGSAVQAATKKSSK